MVAGGCGATGTACCPLVGWIPLAAALLISVFGVVVGVFPLLLGRGDLGRMDRGEIDSSGRGSTKTGIICGIIGVVLSVLDLLCGIVLLILLIAGIGFMAIGNAPH
jgi:hypothetical protein